MTAAQIKKRNKFLKAKDRQKAQNKVRKMEAKLGPIPMLPWYTFLPEDLR